LLRRLTGRRVLVTLNTRRSARHVRDALAEAGVAPLEFLTADVTPKERLEAIGRIKAGGRCVVVATQCVEAGVDIDLGLAIRDFAPLDSLIQVAGRCNRNGHGPRGDVEVVSLVDDRDRAYAEMIYDAVLLQATRRVLGDLCVVDEERVFELAGAYFQELHREKDTGEQVTRAWASWDELDPVRELLRGPESRQESFLVVEQDDSLLDELCRVAAVPDRWDRRREFRGLSARVARVTVSVYSRPGLDPARYADRDPTGTLWVLRPGFYQPGRGLDLRLDGPEAEWGIIL
jgi:CRISPR-associated endonuclease/helicase Cas3